MTEDEVMRRRNATFLFLTAIDYFHQILQFLDTFVFNPLLSQLKDLLKEVYEAHPTAF